jgi:DNA-binding NarL/FixJ family response regulator
MTTPVLIADDHPVVRRGLRDAVEAERGMVVVGEAGDGLEALRLLRELRPHVAVLDVSMPGLDGLDVLAQTRTWPHPPRVVLLTMHDRYARRARELGALGYIRKEDAEDELGACLRAVARGTAYFSPAVAQRDAPPQAPRLAALTAAERRVLRLLGQLKTSRQIGEVMSLSHRTVQNHCANASAKLGLRGPKALLAFALAHKDEL